MTVKEKLEVISSDVAQGVARLTTRDRSEFLISHKMKLGADVLSVEVLDEANGG